MRTLNLVLRGTNRKAHYTQEYMLKRNEVPNLAYNYMKIKNHQEPLYFNSSVRFLQTQRQNRVKDIEWSKSNANLQQNMNIMLSVTTTNLYLEFSTLLIN